MQPMVRRIIPLAADRNTTSSNDGISAACGGPGGRTEVKRRQGSKTEEGTVASGLSAVQGRFGRSMGAERSMIGEDQMKSRQGKYGMGMAKVTQKLARNNSQLVDQCSY